MLTQSVHSTILKLDGTVIRGFTSLTGGVDGALDKLEVDETLNNVAFGVVDGVNYTYTFNPTSVVVESIPDVIAPDSGTGRWELANSVAAIQQDINSYMLSYSGVGLAVQHNALFDFGVSDFSVSIKYKHFLHADTNIAYLISKCDAYELVHTTTLPTNMSVQVIFKNKLYATGGAGKLFAWNGVDTWTEVAPVLSSQTITALVVHSNELYGVTTGGRLFKWNETNAWVEIINASHTMVGQAVSAHGRIYAVSSTLAKIVCWETGTSWVEVVSVPVAATSNMTVMSGIVYYTAQLILSSDYNNPDSTLPYVYKINSDNSVDTIGYQSESLMQGYLFNYDDELYVAASGPKILKWDGTKFVLLLEINSNRADVFQIAVCDSTVIIDTWYSIYSYNILTNKAVVLGYTQLNNAPIGMCCFNGIVYNFGRLSTGTTYSMMKVKSSGYYLALHRNKFSIGLGNLQFVSRELMYEESVVGQSYTVTMVVTRETAITDGSIKLYLNKKLFDTMIIPAQVPVNINTAMPLYMCGNQSTRHGLQLTFEGAAIFNIPLTQDEVTTISDSGVPNKYRKAQVSPIYVSDFSAGVDGFAVSSCVGAGNIDGILGKDNTYRIYPTAVTSDKSFSKGSFPLDSLVELEFDYYIPLTNTNVKYLAVTTRWTQYILEAFPATGQWERVKALVHMQHGVNIFFTLLDSNKSSGFLGTNSVTDDLVYIHNMVARKLGAVARYTPAGFEYNGLVLEQDNALHAIGSFQSVARLLSNTFTVKGVTTWAGTHEAKHICGMNQAQLPVNCYIESIIGVISGTTIEDIVIGDGVDVDRWVAITTGLAAGTVNFTIANRTSDGTNFKLVVDPDANFTGSISWTIKGIIL